MKIRLLLLFTLILSLSCEENKINGNEYTIIDYKPEGLYSFFGKAKSTTLTHDEIEHIELIIQDVVSSIIDHHNSERKKYLSKFPDKKFLSEYAEYFRQYVPAINEYGEKVIWINFFCGKPKTDGWKNGIVDVRDGGDCYFNLKVNLTTQKYYDLSINSDA